MANNRLVIVCRECRLGTTFVKELGGWHAIPGCEERLERFVQKHQACGWLFDRPFEFVYENDTNVVDWQYDPDDFAWPPRYPRG
jgi:hypothetical protein